MTPVFELETLTACPLCDSTRTHHWSSGFDRQHRIVKRTFEYRRCDSCRVVFQSTRPSEASIGDFYPDDYSPHASVQAKRVGKQKPSRVESWLQGLEASTRERTHVAELKREFAAIDAHLKRYRTMVDFGCGSGTYLTKAQKAGCEGIGVDFSPKALEEVRGKGFKALPVSGTTWQTLGQDTIGMFRMNHVIEHLYDPQDTLMHIFNALQPGGLLHLATPNPDGFSASRFKSNWFGLDCPRHIMLLPPATCQALLERVGFKEVRFFYETYPKDLVRSFAYFVRGLLANRVFEDVTSLADNRLLLNLASRFVKVRSLRETGDRYHMTAIKP